MFVGSYSFILELSSFNERTQHHRLLTPHSPPPSSHYSFDGEDANVHPTSCLPPSPLPRIHGAIISPIEVEVSMNYELHLWCRRQWTILCHCVIFFLCWRIYLMSSFIERQLMQCKMCIQRIEDRCYCMVDRRSQRVGTGWLLWPAIICHDSKVQRRCILGFSLFCIMLYLQANGFSNNYLLMIALTSFAMFSPFLLAYSLTLPAVSGTITFFIHTWCFCSC